MKCNRCQSQIDDNESLLSFKNITKGDTKTATLCQKCALGFIEWYASGDQIQKKINNEEMGVLKLEEEAGLISKEFFYKRAIEIAEENYKNKKAL